MKENEFDLAVIGAGPGGYVAAIRSAQLGMKVAIVERDSRLGGTCLLRGCIPTKALLHDAHLLDEIRNAGKHGIHVGEISVDFRKVQERKEAILAKQTRGLEYLMKKNKIVTVKGNATLSSPGRIAVTGDGASTELIAKNTIVATGSEARSLPGYDIDQKHIITNVEALALNDIPESMVIVGAGAVGVEFASIYASFGTKVTLLELLPHLVPIEDEDLGKELRRAFEKRGMAVHTSARLESARVKDDAVEVTFTTARNETKKVTAARLLMATGRAPNTKDIGLEKLGIAMDRDLVKVDSFMKTNVPGIYAIGDIVPTPALAHVASHEGALAAEAIAGKHTIAINYNHVPNATYCHPQVASVGLTEARAKAAGHKVRVGRFPFMPLGKAVADDAPEGFVKIVADEKYGEILGVHMIGAVVTEMVAEATAVMALEATVDDLIHTIHAHPTMAEAIHEAMEDVYKSAIHI